MTIDEALKEWTSKPRDMGCVSATGWFCKRVQGFWPMRYSMWNEQGGYSEHVVASNGLIEIDLTPHLKTWDYS